MVRKEGGSSSIECKRRIKPSFSTAGDLGTCISPTGPTAKVCPVFKSGRPSPCSSLSVLQWGTRVCQVSRGSVSDLPSHTRLPPVGAGVVGSRPWFGPEEDPGQRGGARPVVCALSSFLKER